MALREYEKDGSQTCVLDPPEEVKVAASPFAQPLMGPEKADSPNYCEVPHGGSCSGKCGKLKPHSGEKHNCDACGNDF